MVPNDPSRHIRNKVKTRLSYRAFPVVSLHFRDVARQSYWTNSCGVTDGRVLRKDTPLFLCHLGIMMIVRLKNRNFLFIPRIEKRPSLKFFRFPLICETAVSSDVSFTTLLQLPPKRQKLTNACSILFTEADVSPVAVIILLLASLNSCSNPWIYLAFSGSLLNQMRVCITMLFSLSDTIHCC